MVVNRLEGLKTMEDEMPRDYRYHPWPEYALSLAVKGAKAIYKQIPKDERLKLRDQARIILNTKSERSESKIRKYVIEIWLIRQRVGEKHESER